MILAWALPPRSIGVCLGSGPPCYKLFFHEWSCLGSGGSARLFPEVPKVGRTAPATRGVYTSAPGVPRRAGWSSLVPPIRPPSVGVAYSGPRPPGGARRQVQPARSRCRCSRRRRRHRGARALFYPGFLLSPGISGDIAKGRPGSCHGGQGLPLLPHCQEGKLQLGGAPGQRGGQGRGRTRPPHTCTSGFSATSPCIPLAFSLSPPSAALLRIAPSNAPSRLLLAPLSLPLSPCAREPQFPDAASLLLESPADRTPVSV